MGPARQCRSCLALLCFAASAGVAHADGTCAASGGTCLASPTAGDISLLQVGRPGHAKKHHEPVAKRAGVHGAKLASTRGEADAHETTGLNVSAPAATEPTAVAMVHGGQNVSARVPDGTACVAKGAVVSGIYCEDCVTKYNQKYMEVECVGTSWGRNTMTDYTCSTECAAPQVIPGATGTARSHAEDTLRYWLPQPDQQGFMRGWHESAAQTIGGGYNLLEGNKSSAPSRTCFLSKKTVFTLPDKNPLTSACSTSTGLQAVDTKMRTDSSCTGCLQKMEATVTHENYKQKKNGLVGADPSSGKPSMPEECKKCGGMWWDECMPKGGTYTDEDRRKDFEAQEDFMRKLGVGLATDHDVDLYLDFADNDADQMVRDWGGRDVAFDKPVMYEGMLSLLKLRAQGVVKFVHWEGAGGDFCMAERAGGEQREPNGKAVLRFPPIGGAIEGVNNSPLCRKDSNNLQGGSFLQQVCEACGGINCAAACPRQ